MSIAHRISAWNRHRKWSLFLSSFPPAPTTRLLDVGFSEDEHSPTDNYLERFYPNPAQITALGIDKADEFSRRYPLVKAVTYSGSTFPFADQSFDVVWSNAVVEHVGDHDRQVAFLAEIQRVGKHGFITTPNRFFPVEVHTRVPLLHWLPKPWFDWLLVRMGKGFASGDYMHLSSRSQFIRMLERAGYRNFRIHDNRLLGFTLDFVAVF